MRDKTKRLTAILLAAAMCAGQTSVLTNAEAEDIVTESAKQEEKKAEEKQRKSEAQTENTKAESEPQTESKKVESEPQTEGTKAESEPLTEGKKPESELQTESMKQESESQTESAKSEKEPQAESTKAESESQTENTKADETDAKGEKKEDNQSEAEKSEEKKEAPVVINEQGERLNLEKIEEPKTLTCDGKELPLQKTQGIYRVRVSKQTKRLQITVPDQGAEETLTVTGWNGYLTEAEEKWHLCPDDPKEGAVEKEANQYTVNLEQFAFSQEQVTLEQLAVYGTLSEKSAYCEIFLHSEARTQILLIELTEKEIEDAETESTENNETESSDLERTESEITELETAESETTEMLELTDSADLIAAYATKKDIDQTYSAAGKNLNASAEKYTPTVASINGEWQMLGLARSEQAVSESLRKAYLANVENTLKEKDGVLHKKKYTEYSRVILALTALGEDVTNVAGYNLLEPLADYDKTVWQGVNGAIFALIAFDSHNYEIPKAAEGCTQTTRENLISCILSQELSGGGWDLGNQSADTDVTAMAIQALAPYCASNAKVKAAVDRGIAKLSALQKSNGAYGSYGTVNSESCSQVIVALTAVGIDPNTDSRFVKNGKSVLDALISFSQKDGSFKHIADGNADQMATEQAFYALTAYERYSKGQNRLYDMTDVAIKENGNQSNPGTGNGNSNSNKETNKETNKEPGSDSGKQTEKNNGTSNKVPGGSTQKVNLVSSNRTGGTFAGSSSGGSTSSSTTEAESESESESENSSERTTDKKGGTKTNPVVTKLISDMNALFTSAKKGVKLPKAAADYTDAQVQSIVSIYQQLSELEEAEQKEVEKSSRYASYLEVLDLLGEENHYDEQSGVDARDNEAENLPWYVQMEVSTMLVEEETAKTVSEALKGQGEMLSQQEISMTDLLTGGEWVPEEFIRISVPSIDLGEYENAAVVHMKEDGGMEFLETHVAGEKLEFDTDGFSRFGIVGFHGTMEELMTESEEEFYWIYLLPGGAAAVLLFLMGILRMFGKGKKKQEAQERER